MRRIVSHPKYPNSAGSLAAVAPIPATLRQLPGHTFWPDDLSLVDPAVITTHGRVTDTYLLALAVKQGGRLVAFDRRISPKAARGSQSGLSVIDSAA